MAAAPDDLAGAAVALALLARAAAGLAALRVGFFAGALAAAGFAAPASA